MRMYMIQCYIFYGKIYIEFESKHYVEWYVFVNILLSFRKCKFLYRVQTKYFHVALKYLTVLQNMYLHELVCYYIKFNKVYKLIAPYSIGKHIQRELCYVMYFLCISFVLDLRTYKVDLASRQFID